ncbi:MAG: MFS transporter [Methanomethylophilus sp.]|jgi:MFS family permease
MSEEYTDRDRTKVMVCTFLGSFVTPLMSTMLNLALVAIGEDFEVGSHDLGYINSIFLLGSVIAMVPAGRLSGIVGMRKTFATGLAVTFISALAASLSPNYWFLVACRFFIGMGAAMMIVTSVAMLTYVYPANRRGWALGMNSTAVYLGLTLGPTLGGFISDSAVGWRGCFMLVLILCIIVAFFIKGMRYEIRPNEGEQMDWKGSVLWGVSIFVLMNGVMSITESWAIPAVIVGSILLLITIHYLKGASFPVLNLRLFKIKTFSRAGGAAFLNYGASYSVMFFLSLYLQSIGEMTATEAGLFLLVQPAIQVLLTAKMGEVYDGMEDKRILPTLGMAMMAVGISLFLFLGTDFSMWYILLIMIVIGSAMGVFSSPNTTAIMSSAPDRFRGEASGVVAVMRQSGMMVSMGIAMACISIIMGSADNLTPDRWGEFVDTIHVVFTICLVMCLVGTVLSWFRGKTDEDTLNSL